MLISFEARDKAVLFIALSLLEKAVEAAKKAAERINVSTLEIDTLEARCGAARKHIHRTADEETGELHGDHDVPGHLADTIRTACWLYLDQLGKVEQKQVELLVETDETKVRANHLRELHARFGDQTTITFRMGDSEPVTLTGDQLSEAASRI